jgi:hypothetical protein
VVIDPGALPRGGRSGPSSCSIRAAACSTPARVGRTTTINRLGHKTAQETLDTYGHLWSDDEELTREAVGNERKQGPDGMPGTGRARGLSEQRVSNCAVSGEQAGSPPHL